jgi:ParB family chromosome partitioning protein
LTEVPAVVRETEDRGSLEQAVIENLHRDDLNPIDEAAAFHRLMDEFGLTQHQVAVRVSRSRSAVANSLRLLHLPDGVQQMIMDGQISAGHARALAGLGDRQLLEQLAMRVVEEGMSVRQTEEMVRALGDVSIPGPPPVDGPVVEVRDAAALEVEQILSDRFDTRVRVQSRGRKGRIVVEFADREDLQRLFRLLGG